MIQPSALSDKHVLRACLTVETGVVAIIGLLAGGASLRDSLLSELSDAAGSVPDLNQPLSPNGAAGANATTGGSGTGRFNGAPVVTTGSAGGAFFGGTIGGVSIYNRALTAGEVNGL